ncbi:fructosamine-3-kinase isoform X2 [Pteropus medius]|uniref:fructosamine-3-kinase isoform X2 n=1 Tax=Pteropus vampyrus TaxID=132908 RepID=UPI00196B3B56|nr:fructosamine-3-kinase isoform X2 [Pteropus giganteus]
MEQLLRAELRTSTLRAFGSPGAGCISEGHAYDTDSGPVFVKVNRRTQARQMFEGEVASLQALRSTGTVRAPRPIKVIDLPGGGAAFVMEHLKMRSLSSQASKLGDQVAELHLHNQKLRDKLREQESTVGRRAEGAVPQHVAKFGFHTVTCCGFIPQVNEWQDDWPTFFTRHRLQAQLDLIEKDYADREARELWSQLQVSDKETVAHGPLIPVCPMTVFLGEDPGSVLWPRDCPCPSPWGPLVRKCGRGRLGAHYLRPGFLLWPFGV